MKQIYRQGDILLISIESLPENLKEKDKTIAEGETHGHSHKFTSEQVQVFEDDSGNQFVEIQQESKLIHEEHAELAISEGTYFVVQQREFDILDGLSNVQD